MNPFPLRGPDRVIYAYACETCGKVGKAHESVFIPTPDERKTLVAKHRETSKEYATACCTCSDCGRALGPSERKPHPVFGSTVSMWTTSMCPACEERMHQKRAWDSWLWAWGDIGRAIANGITDAAAWRAFNKDDDE